MRLTVENLHVWRGDRHVLRGVGFELHAGEVLQVTGPNGAGKTTLLRTLCGLVHAEDGRVSLDGADVREDLAAFHAGLGYLGHDAPLKAELTVRENLRYWVGVRRTSHADIEPALERLGVLAAGDRLTRTLSAGQRRRVALAGVVALDVPLWVLDEPTTHLDPQGQALVARLIDEHASRGGLVIAAIHHPLATASARPRELGLAA